LNNTAPLTKTQNIVMLIFGLILIIVSLALIVFWIWMLVDAIRRPIKNKALWLIIIIFLGCLGAILYYFIGRKDLKKSSPDYPYPPSAPATQQPPTIQTPTSTTQSPQSN